MTLVSDARAIVRAGISAVDPARAVRTNLRRRGSVLTVGPSAVQLDPAGSIRLVALGKAAGAMLDAALSAVGGTADTIAVTPRGYPRPRSGRPVLFGDHPVPGEGSFRAGRSLLRFVATSGPADLVVFLVSGGGSAVAELPSGQLRPAELARTTTLLLASGAPIGTMNGVRRHLSRLKGGQLATAVPSGRFVTLALSDVVGDAPENIASGPTVVDPTTFAGALSGLRRYDLLGRVPARVVAHLTQGAAGGVPETPKPGDPRFRRSPFVLVGSNGHALVAAGSTARRLGYRVEIVDQPITGATVPAARRFVRRFLAGRALRPQALLGGGETTVVLGPRPGHGGRNQEFALSCAHPLAGRSALVLSAGTDGIDGPTDAAGGWTDGSSWDRARRRGIDIPRSLAHHDAYPALERLGSLLRTGPTGTNVMDLHVGLRRPDLNPGTAGSTTPGGARTSRRRRS